MDTLMEEMQPVVLGNKKFVSLEKQNFLQLLAFSDRNVFDVENISYLNNIA